MRKRQEEEQVFLLVLSCIDRFFIRSPSVVVVCSPKTEKKKSKKKKSKAANSTQSAVVGPLIPQTEPPTVPVSRQYKNGQYPIGECHPYLDEYVRPRPSNPFFEISLSFYGSSPRLADPLSLSRW